MQCFSHNMKTIYITTPIYYVNAKPHLGHAYTTVVCDIFVRFHRMLGHKIKFTTGTDEHGKKIEQSAKAASIEPQIFVDKISKLFRELLQTLNISNDDFIRTTELRHKKSVANFWQELKSKEYIYLSEYSGWYDIRNEAYFAEGELIDGKSPLGGDVQYITEPCYFFKLSMFQDKLLDLYETYPDFIYPVQRKNEVVSFVRQGLKDLAISRASFKWGIPVPDDPEHVIYVWLDALVNYLSSIGYPNNFDKTTWGNATHFVGKEIVRFHAVYWPAFLMAAGLPLPKQIIAHGWWLSEGEKMSKSLGNVQDPTKYCKIFGADALRYFMIRDLPFGADGNFSLSGFLNRYNSFLANSYGNLCHRTLSFIKTRCENGTITKPIKLTDEDIAFTSDVTTLLENAMNSMTKYAFSYYIEKIENAIAIANQYIDQQKPWILKNEDKADRMNTVLFILLEQIYKVTKFLYPVIPNAAESILKQMNIPYELTLDLKEGIPDTVTINNSEIVFQKIDITDLSKFDVYAESI